MRDEERRRRGGGEEKYRVEQDCGVEGREEGERERERVCVYGIDAAILYL